MMQPSLQVSVCNGLDLAHRAALRATGGRDKVVIVSCDE